MKSRHSFTSALILLVSLTSVALGADEFQIDGLTDDPWVKEVGCRGNPNREARGWIGNNEIRLCFQFDERLLQPTSDGTTNYSEMYVITYVKKGAPSLTYFNIVPISPEDNPGLIIGKTEPAGAERSSNLSTARAYKVSIEITHDARSKRYPIAAAITAPGIAEQRLNFRLPILSPDTAAIEVERKPGAPVDCWAGSECSPLELVVRNKLPYKITISNITVSSDDLLQNKPKGEYGGEIANSLSPYDLNVSMIAKPITFKRVFSGFGVPQVTMRIDYKDEFGRPMFTQTTADLQIRPNILVIAILVILGAVIGTFIRVDLGRLERRGVITRRQRVVFAVTTFASGIAVCLIALFANIKLVVLSDQNSYSAWEPKILFFTALVATVSGLPILYAYLKLPRQPLATPPQPDNPQGADH